MGYKAAAVILVNSFLIHIFIVFDNQAYLVNDYPYSSDQAAINIAIGIALLLFPMFGLVADVCLTRYKMIQVALFILAGILIFIMIYLLSYCIVLLGFAN